MFFYVVTFQYAQKWHIDCFERDTRYDVSSEKDRLWLIEAARFAAERQKLRQEDNNLQNVCLYELSLRIHEKTAMPIFVPQYPIDEIDLVKIVSNE